MVSFSNNSVRGRRQTGLRELQQMQAEIYRQLQLLMPDEVAHHDRFVSRIPGSPVLRMEILERHAYTHFVRLTYDFSDQEQERIAPDAHIRIYHDARLAEVTAFNQDQAFVRSAHPWYPSKPLLEKIARENMALDKWLGYLLQQGHSFETMGVAKQGIPAEATEHPAVITA